MRVDGWVWMAEIISLFSYVLQVMRERERDYIWSDGQSVLRWLKYDTASVM